MKDGMPVIDAELCTGCGVCVNNCPKNVLELIPVDAPVYVPCNSRETKAKDVTSVCDVGCIHCKACTVKAKGVVNMVNDRIEIDYDNLTEDQAKAGVWACSKQFIFRYRDPGKQAQAVREIQEEKAAKKAKAAAKKEGAGEAESAEA
jgi:ferredoxin